MTRKNDNSPVHNPYDARILQVLALAKRPLTTRQISAYSGISYNTTTGHLKTLLKKNTVIKKRESNRIYWMI